MSIRHYLAFFSCLLQAFGSIAQTETKDVYVHQVFHCNAHSVDKILANFSTYQTNGHELRLTNKIESNTGTHFHFQHFYQGAEVIGSSLTIHLPQNAKVSPIVQQNLAIMRVKSDVLELKMANPKHDLVWYPNTSGLELARRIKGGTEKHPTTIIANEKGTLEERTQKLYFQGPDSLVKAKVFLINPINTAEVEYGGQYVDNKDSTNSSLDSQLREVTMRVRYENDTFFLGDDRFMFQNVIDPATPPVFSLSDTFFYNRSDENFEEVNAFYHLSNYANYLEQIGYGALLFDTLVVDADAGLADASAFDPNPSPKTLEYGLGGVDDAEDGEVVVHEMIHSLSTKASPKTVRGSDRRAMEEGNADYLASTYSNSFTQFKTNRVFSWDGHNEFWQGLINNSSKNYKTDRTGFTNHDREIWSAVLMCIYDKCGRGITDSLVLEHFYYQYEEATMPEMANILLRMDTIQNNAANSWEMKQCFLEQGILEPGSVRPQPKPADLRILNTYEFGLGTGSMFVESPQHVSFEITIYDMKGSTVLESASENGVLEIQPTTLTPGSYVLNIQYNGLIYRQKILRF